MRVKQLLAVPALATAILTGCGSSARLSHSLATRLAAGNPVLWSAILHANATGVLQALDRYTEQLARFRSALEANDRAAVEALLAHGKKIKDALSNP